MYVLLARSRVREMAVRGSIEGGGRAVAPLLQVRDLRTEFVTQDGVVKAVNGISYDLEKGETFAIVGESGCGKSVSALSIMRLVPEPPGRIAGGRVIFDGQDLLQTPRKQMVHIRGAEIAMVFQDPMTSLNPVMTIERQVSEALEFHKGLSRHEGRKAAIRLLEMVGIPHAEERVHDFPYQFSGGMRQRVMIATALSCEPKLLIADEPTTALDVTIQAQIIEVVKELRQELGMAIIWITHDLGVVAGLADRVAVMYAGKIVEAAPVDELYANPRHPYTLGLLGSIPRLDAASKSRLTPIEGLPPDLIGMRPCCPFSPRCGYAIERCLHENPLLESAADGHLRACWVDDLRLPSGEV